MNPSELAADLRSHINPAYAAQLGTESYERRLCAEVIEGLTEELASIKNQKPMACAICSEAHSILDADDSKIIRNTSDGYPEGREPRELTLAERVIALCVYAADWKRWCIAAQERKPLSDERIMELLGPFPKYANEWEQDDYLQFARAIEREHNIKAQP